MATQRWVQTVPVKINVRVHRVVDTSEEDEGITLLVEGVVELNVNATEAVFPLWFKAEVYLLDDEPEILDFYPTFGHVKDSVSAQLLSVYQDAVLHSIRDSGLAILGL